MAQNTSKADIKKRELQNSDESLIRVSGKTDLGSKLKIFGEKIAVNWQLMVIYVNNSR